MAVLLVGLAYQVEEFVLVAVAAGVALATGEVVAWLAARRARRRMRVDVGHLPGEVLVGDAVHLPAVVHSSTGWVNGMALDTASTWHVSFPGLPGGRGPRRPERSGRRRGGGRAAFSAIASRVLAPPTLVRLPDLGYGGRWEWAVTVPTTRRGMWTLDPLRLWCTDPLGLVARRVTSSPPAHVAVCPDPSAESVPDSVPNPVDVRRGAIDTGVAGLQEGGDELQGLRPYVPGDRLSRLHWPALSRSGDLLVRHFADSLAVRLELLVDVRQAHLERSVMVAAALGVAATEAGEEVVVRTTAGESLSVPAGSSARRMLLQALAVIGPATRR